MRTHAAPKGGKGRQKLFCWLAIGFASATG
jgi:hypothetical protein